MSDFEKDFFRKIKVRKETIINMNQSDERLFRNEMNPSTIDLEPQRIYNELENNLKEAKENYYQDGYWNIDGPKISLLVKKTLRKMLKIFFGWYLFPIYSKQTNFNGKTVNVMSLTRELVLEQKKHIDELVEKMSYIQSEFENKVNQYELITIQQDKELFLLKKQFENNSTFHNNEVSNLDEYDFNNKMLYIYQSELKESKEELAEISELYYESICNKIDKMKVSKECIIVLTKRFKSEFGMEAIKNEAYDIYTILRTNTNHDVKLVSIESADSDVDKSSDIIYTCEETLFECFEKLNPSLIIYCESTLYDVLGFNGLLLKYKTLLKLSSQNPAYLLKETTLEELRHANDYGVINISVESKYAYNKMDSEGFKDLELFYPVINYKRVQINRKRKFKDDFVVGFASSPMIREQFENRGMNNLENLVRLLPNIKFKILWRNEDLELPAALLEANNCYISYGKYDMSKFYNEVDCMIIPYDSLDNNHACSLSAVEAMMNNIPVVSTNISGISEIINLVGMGEVCGNNAEELSQAIINVKDNYNNYIGKNKQKEICSIFSGNDFVNYVELCLKKYFPKEFVTLAEWDYRLKEDGKYLVKGHDNIKNYYQNMEVAENYNFERFIQFPGNYFDEFERVSIRSIFETYYNSNELNILDIASGDGRIVQEDIKYGKCLSTDTSEAMLAIVKKRFQKSCNLDTRICDYFVDEINHQFDAITTFRYIRHFDYPQRKDLYSKIKRNLKDEGLLIFDAPNIKYAMLDKSDGNWRHYNIYDAFWTVDSIVSELRDNGFEVKYIIPIGIKVLESEPVSWTVAATKISV